MCEGRNMTPSALIYSPTPADCEVRRKRPHTKPEVELDNER